MTFFHKFLKKRNSRVKVDVFGEDEN